MESTETATSHDVQFDPRIEPLVRKVFNGEDLPTTLEELRTAAKGNDWAKGFIGERLSSHLVMFIKNESPEFQEIRVEAAKLLRSITVYRKNKTLGTECASIIKVLNVTDIRALRLALTATLWNLSALAENRLIIVESRGLHILSQLLESGDVGLQREAAGAIRNITLDDECREAFTESTLSALISLLTKTEDLQLLVCISGALRNLSTSDHIRKMMATEKCVRSLCETILFDNSKLQNLCLSVLHKISQEENTSSFISKHFLPSLYEPLIQDGISGARESTLAILKNIKVEHPDNKLEIQPNEPDGHSTITDIDKYSEDLIKNLNLEGNMSYRDILLVKKIGEGQYGDVWMGKYHDYPVACKILKRQMTDKESEKAIEELKLMAKLKHPNVVLFMGACLNDQKQICIVTEFASRGDLRTVAPQVKSLAKRLKLGLDVASGLAWIHANGIVHRDLKLPNLLVFEDWSVKIADFGLSLQLEEGVSINRFGGNVKYSAPEILKARYDESITIYPYSEKTDVYSFGLMFWELVTLKPLFIRPKEYKGKKGLAKYVLSGYRPAIEKNWPQSLTTILSNCWHQDPNRRPLFREIIGQWPSLTIDVLCPDKWGREVCKVLFVAQETVPFVEFIRAFSQTCFANPQTLQTKKMYRKFLSVLLCENEFDDTVSKQRFCNIVGWFSPIDKSQDCAKFFGRMKDLLTRRYFHGFLSETKAENQLKQLWDSTSNKQSYYVIRFSESDVGAFILTFIDFNGHIQHEKILNRGGMWYVEGLAEEYDSWSKVKQAFKQVWNIGYHLPKSPYSNLFKTGMFG